ncbi:MFS transporter [Roseobacter denitrificans]|uniref:Major Facilitator Superfamily (MFS) transporter, permease component, putative n=1 Tax=Roseobacter denitrificans (strain ATCC 33942 / OCh 114) TaxID=375451 RepID=Q16D61_ROSDO|nr:MFS transporter [Roseobacter denitrificans]ABG30082.1 major Facilitator Superfamily (MFS) transporter, permease component, putative [Roseobacter denitrificans OCh 114]AVL53280.1 MFS transporter [Roseobacter denitrificans]SFF69386.1 MFS transporter, UMF1 family [Roseobacter denitrificans OCh 114]
MSSTRQRIWGWYFFDWASQPYNTLLLTFIFGPYFAQTATETLIADGMAANAARAQAQAYWGYGLTAAGIAIAVLAPLLGSIADGSGRRMPWIVLFSTLYVVGAAGLWWTAPADFSILWALFFFGIGLIGMEFATIFTNSFLPELHPNSNERGRISGSGWAFGYLGGVVALAIMLVLFQAGDTGRTIAGLSPLFGLDPDTGADTRIVGPLTAAWFMVFIIPFFLHFRDIAPRHTPQNHLRIGLIGLRDTLVKLPRTPSLLAYLGSSMFYRDALNGLYTFGGIYALGVLGWSIMDIGIFGILAAISGAVFCWIGGHADRRIGPMPVIIFCCVTLILTSGLILSLTPRSILGIALADGSAIPDVTFYIAGALIGAAGGALQSSSRTMMTHQANPDRMTEGFGLYALSGKATSFLAPASIAIVSDLTGSQRMGITPIVVLFILGLILLIWVKPKGDYA